jgi:hypothetical protein
MAWSALSSETEVKATGKLRFESLIRRTKSFSGVFLLSTSGDNSIVADFWSSFITACILWNLEVSYWISPYILAYIFISQR